MPEAHQFKAAFVAEVKIKDDGVGKRTFVAKTVFEVNPGGHRGGSGVYDRKTRRSGKISCRVQITGLILYYQQPLHSGAPSFCAEIKAVYLLRGQR
jgi:hypothetical protein